ncbi:MAG: hypothetical protein QOD44_273, partial [Solirubrobacteraceae bacterium]|nr:hypothetical protein [Solirubrobacteraceae bacterium]
RPARPRRPPAEPGDAGLEAADAAPALASRTGPAAADPAAIEAQVERVRNAGHAAAVTPAPNGPDPVAPEEE